LQEICNAPTAGTPDQPALDKLLAPIALYPDALLAQVLACAGSPQQVTEVNNWLKQNSQLQGSEVQQAAESAGSILLAARSEYAQLQ
jgi:hypothetical protein